MTLGSGAAFTHWCYGSMIRFETSVDLRYCYCPVWNTRFEYIRRGLDLLTLLFVLVVVVQVLTPGRLIPGNGFHCPSLNIMKCIFLAPVLSEVALFTITHRRAIAVCLYRYNSPVIPNSTFLRYRFRQTNCEDRLHKVTTLRSRGGVSC